MAGLSDGAEKCTTRCSTECIVTIPPRNIVTARLMTRRHVDAVMSFQDHEMVIYCLWVIPGFKQCEVAVIKHATSKTSYGLSKKIEHATNVVTNFSIVPLKLIFYLGFAVIPVRCRMRVIWPFTACFFQDGGRLDLGHRVRMGAGRVD